MILYCIILICSFEVTRFDVKKFIFILTTILIPLRPICLCFDTSLLAGAFVTCCFLTDSSKDYHNSKSNGLHTLDRTNVCSRHSNICINICQLGLRARFEWEDRLQEGWEPVSWSNKQIRRYKSLWP